MQKLTQEEQNTIASALGSYKADVKKMMVKAEKLGLKEAADIKRTFLGIDVLLAKVKK